MENVSRIEDYKEENEEYNARIEGYLEELNKNIKYVLSEQEKQRLNQMTITEVQTEMLRVLHCMKCDLDELLGRDI